MDQYLYRFRSLNALLGPDDGYSDGFDELRTQTIFFAQPEDLNDPMEGFKDMFWSGDEIVWGNLFRHYLLCLEKTFINFMLFGGDENIDRSTIGVSSSKDEMPKEVRELHDRICEAFFAIDGVALYPVSLAKRRGLVRRDELSKHLQVIHCHALKCICEAYVQHDLMPPLQGNTFEHLPDIKENAELCEKLNLLEEETPDVPDGIEKIMAVSTHISTQLSMITRYNLQQQTTTRQNQFFLLSDFPREYVRQLEVLIYSDWYSASFSKNCSNSSIWGNYTNGHKGICLKFRVKEQDGKLTLPLKLKTGFSGNREIYGTVPLQFYPVIYSTSHPSIDFFRSMGTLPIPKLNSTWFCDISGRRSVCHDDMFNDEKGWRQRHYENFYQSTTTKTLDWAYEQEYRLILNPIFCDYSAPSERRIKYDIADLEGIIFGIQTPISDKLAVMRIIEGKCRETGMQSTKFFQAYFNRMTGQIDNKELDFMKFTS